MKKKYLPTTRFVHGRLKEATPELGDLTDGHLKILHYFAQHVMMVTDYEITMDLTKSPKEIRILPYDDQNRPLRITMKNREVFDRALYGMLQLPDVRVKIGVEE